MDGKWILCEHCIAAIKSRGEKLYVGDEIDIDCWEDEHEEKLKCEWCEDSDISLYECVQ